MLITNWVTTITPSMNHLFIPGLLVSWTDTTLKFLYFLMLINIYSFGPSYFLCSFKRWVCRWLWSFQPSQEHQIQSTVLFQEKLSSSKSYHLPITSFKLVIFSFFFLFCPIPFFCFIFIYIKYFTCTGIPSKELYCQVPAQTLCSWWAAQILELTSGRLWWDWSTWV